MTKLLVDYGLVLLFLLVAIESAGIPLPGETALITAAVLAHDHFGIQWVIVVAAAGAIVGDNIGYWLGRVGGRKLLDRFELTRRYAERVLPPAERFFKRHGGKTVFFGRFVAFLRVTSAWLAGISRMHWWEFAAWNAAGGIIWATASVCSPTGRARRGRRGPAVRPVRRHRARRPRVVAFLGLRMWRKRMEAA